MKKLPLISLKLVFLMILLFLGEKKQVLFSLQ